ncbi:MAG: hypothetical protein OXN20_12370 [Gemmatimonadota bacterium]|nr:hypothetical protein [Gemmatimonadota bacterium]
MPENIFEHTTSIAGLTCKPLSILSEIISPQEMSMVRGGTDGMGGGGPGSMSSGQNPDEAKTEKDAWKQAGQQAAEEQRKPTEQPGLGVGTVGGTYVPIIDVSGSLNTNAQADSSGTQDLNGGDLDNGLGSFWDFDFSDDDTEDECTVPLDCGDDEEEEDYSEDETEEDTEVYDP